MPEQIKFYYKNATSEIVDFEHGIAQDELDQLASQITQITADMSDQRKNGKLPYRDLPYQQEMVAQVKELAGELKGRFDNLVVQGIGG